MSRIKEYVLPLLFTFGITAISCVFFLYLTGYIPQSLIRENIEKSAEYFYEEELFPYLIAGKFHTRQDNYADSILVNIIYHIEEKNLFSSLMESSYYNPEGENVNISLWDAVQEPKEANIVYDRYWHGSMVLLRPLFIFTDITGVRIILGVLLLILTFLVSFFLYKKGEKYLALCYILGPLFVQAWMGAFCVEYITTFLVMNVITLAVLFLFYSKKKRKEAEDKKLFLLMVVSGALTCFFDFLTTETLTVTVPLFVLLVLRYRTKQLKETKKEILRLAGTGAVWGISYVGMFLLKWSLSSLVLGRNAFQSAMSSVEERTLGTVSLGNSNLDPEANPVQKLLGALGRNQGMIFPFKDEMRLGNAFLAYFGILFLAFAIIYMFRGKNLSFKMLLLSGLLAAVPYLRYLVLSNHSYLHYFFTYRAQLIVILVLMFCCWEFGLSNLFKANAAKKKKVG